MNSVDDTIRRPFIEHINELRTRLVWISLAVAAAGGAAFAFHQQLLDIIQRPLHQTLYYTSPTGGVTFVFQLCLTVGIVGGFPVIVYNIYKFLSPVLAQQKRITVFLFITTSFVLACLGVVFAYFVSLPAALVFLTQFGGDSVKSLITANEYFSFALAYLGGFAILFQIPLLIMLINRVKPLKPGGMLKNMRWIILGSFIVAALLTPTPDPINQTIMAAPIIILYLVSVVLVFFINRRHRPRVVNIQPAYSFDFSKNLAKTAIKKSLRNVAPQPQKIFSDIMVPPIRHRAIQLTERPRPALRNTRNTTPPIFKKQDRTPPFVGRRRQSIDGIII